jgi:hypothetical protein
MVPDIIVPSTDEKTLRQYKYAEVSAVMGKMKADMVLAVTNKRIIQHAETKHSKKSQLIHNEIFIENIGGFSFFRGKRREKGKLPVILTILGFIFVAIAVVLFLQAQPIYDAAQSVFSTVTLDVFKILITALPIVIFIIIAIILNAISYKYLINMVIYSKGLKAHNLFSEEPEILLDTQNYIIVPYLKETQAMISELASIILDIQKFGPDEALKHIEAEEGNE